MFENKKVFIRDLIITIGSIAVCSFAAMFFRVVWGGTDLVCTAYILAVVIVARLTNGYLWGILTSFLGVVAANYFFTYPYFYFNFVLPGYKPTFMVMFIISLTVSMLMANSKVATLSSKERERKSESLNKLNREFSSCTDARQVIYTTLEFLKKNIDFQIYIYLDEGDKNKPYVVSSLPDESENEPDRAVVYYTYVNGKVLIRDDRAYVPIMADPDIYGVIVINKYDVNFTTRGILLLELIANQTALAIKLTKAWEAQKTALMEAERERTRNTLLRSISHDLRTPLTSIWGAGNAIIEAGSNMSNEEKYKLVKDINEEARWLNQMVENLLAVTKIDAKTEMVKKSPEVIEEIIEEAVSRLKTRFPSGDIHVKIPTEVLVAPMDQTLIKQVIINIVENSFKHAGYDSKVSIELSKKDDMAVISIEDNGLGIADDMIAQLFDMNMSDNITGDEKRGYGLGLPLCKSIVKAHGGILAGENMEGGGLRLYFTIPLEEVCYE